MNLYSKCFVYFLCQVLEPPVSLAYCKAWMSHSSLYDETFEWQLPEACAHLLGELSLPLHPSSPGKPGSPPAPEWPWTMTVMEVKQNAQL